MSAFIEIEAGVKVCHPGGVPSYVEVLTEEQETAVSALVAQLGYSSFHKITADFANEQLLIWQRPGTRPFVVRDGRFAAFVEMVRGESDMSLADFKAQQAAQLQRRKLVEELYHSDADIEKMLAGGEGQTAVFDLDKVLAEISEINGVGQATLKKIEAILSSHLDAE